MTAIPASTTVAAPPRLRRRTGLTLKFALAFIGLVTLVLLVNGAVNVWLSYEEAKRATVRVQREKAQAAAERIDLFVSGIEQQIGWTTRAEWARMSPEQRSYDFIRLLRQVPAITELVHVGGDGKEQLKLSRLEPDVVAGGSDYSADPRFTNAVANKIWFSPVSFRRGSEPYMTIAMAHAGRRPGVSIAEVNLKLIWDVVTAIKIGVTGKAFIVEAGGRLVAHPDMSLVLRSTDLSKLPKIASALAGEGGDGAPATLEGLDGQSVLLASAPIARLNWTVFVELPVSEALAPVYASLAQTGALLALGLALAAVMGSLLARRMVVPIQRLQAGAEKLGAGLLGERIDIHTGDEIETLAGSFNQMAGRIEESHASLEAKVAGRTRDLNEALAQQTATADVLKVISRSAFDLKPVLEALTVSAATLSAADAGIIFLRDGDVLRAQAIHGAGPEFMAFLEANPRKLTDPSLAPRVARSGKIEHIPDVRLDEDYSFPGAFNFGNARTLLGIPLTIDGRVEGVFALGRFRTEGFTRRQIDLVQSFADQAAIAIGNVRLFDEVQAKTRDLSEALQQQTATADVLKVISRSAFDLDAVLKTLIATGADLCAAPRGVVWLRNGETFDLAASVGYGSAWVDLVRGMHIVPDPQAQTSAGIVAFTGEMLNVGDFANDPRFMHSDAYLRGDYRSGLMVPLICDGKVEGAMGFTRPTPGLFTQRHVELVQTFADQAVIAIQNVRLFDEVQERTRDLGEALEFQTATGDVLGVISKSPNDLQPVLDAIVATARRLCDSDSIVMFLLRDGRYHAAAFNEIDNIDPGFLAHIRANPIAPDQKGSVVARAAREGRTVHVPDSAADPEAGSGILGLGVRRAVLAVPLLREGAAAGVVVLRRSLAKPFTQRQIDLVATFADQAVIAIQNVRLFEEVQAKTRDLGEALEQQTATADVLKVISRSTFDLQTVLDTLVGSAVELCDGNRGVIYLKQGDAFHMKAHTGHNEDFVQYLRQNPQKPGRGSGGARVLLTGEIQNIADIQSDAEYDPALRADLRTQGLLGVPLLRDKAIAGAIVVARARPGAFSAREIDLVQTFADQAVIAIQNVRLFDQVQARTRELAASLDQLRATQDRLIQSEKLASLGQLTAGIAHEIKNPLNFVNNFAELSRDLLGELGELLEPATLDEKTRGEVAELTSMLQGNLAKVVQHGKRADSIVKNMLLHSRAGTGEHRPVDINALVEESVNLAYHGARAERPGFNITLAKSLDPAAGEVDLYPQEITRVLLNLIGNGFYAAAKRKAGNGTAGFEPTLTATTKNLGDRVEIKIRDNGTGISDDVRDKMFNPFFTTKPAGEGTGLGLSLSYDIVVKQHGGAIEVETAPGQFTEFTVTLPRARPAKETTGQRQ